MRPLRATHGAGLLAGRASLWLVASVAGWAFRSGLLREPRHQAATMTSLSPADPVRHLC